MKILFYSMMFISMISNSHALEDVHHWNKNELETLKSLSISELPSRPDSHGNQFSENESAAILGKKIFFDTRFSKNGKVSCATCHQPDKYFTDGLKTSKGLNAVRRNAPTLVGVSYSNWFFLDGRADSLWSQALEPMENHNEHGGNRAQHARIIFEDDELKKSYENVFGLLPKINDFNRFPKNAGPVKDDVVRGYWDKMSPKDQDVITGVFVNIGKSLAAYESKLRPAASRFDKYVQAALQNNESKKELLTKKEAQGLRLFISKANCMICHNGPMLTDFSFHNISTPPVNVNKYDWGRYKGVNKVLKSEFNCRGKYNAAKNKGCDELDYIIKEKVHTLGSFKTPSLRNVAKTSPYMHAGQYKTLMDVVKHYNKPPKTKVGQSDLLSITLKDDELESLVAFLQTLNSEIDAKAHWLTGSNKVSLR